MLWILSISLALAVPTKRPPDKERGETLYRENCWQCHGRQGLGDGPMSALIPTAPPKLAGQWKEGDIEGLLRIIQRGEGDMPGYAGIFDRHDTRRILRWLNSLDPETGLPPGKKNDSEDSAEEKDEEPEADEQEAPSTEPDPLGDGEINGSGPSTPGEAPDAADPAPTPAANEPETPGGEEKADAPQPAVEDD